MNKDAINDILEYAIAREQAAHDFYEELARRVDRPGMSEVFAQFAVEELGHKAKLERVKAGKTLLAAKGRVLDLKIADYLVTIEEEGDLDYQRALMLAMQREKASYRLYLDISRSVDDPATKELFLALAQEEAKHKLRFEIEYDEAILSEN